MGFFFVCIYPAIRRKNLHRFLMDFRLLLNHTKYNRIAKLYTSDYTAMLIVLHRRWRASARSRTRFISFTIISIYIEQIKLNWQYRLRHFERKDFIKKCSFDLQRRRKKNTTLPVGIYQTIWICFFFSCVALIWEMLLYFVCTALQRLFIAIPDKWFEISEKIVPFYKKNKQNTHTQTQAGAHRIGISCCLHCVDQINTEISNIDSKIGNGVVFVLFSFFFGDLSMFLQPPICLCSTESMRLFHAIQILFLSFSTFFWTKKKKDQQWSKRTTNKNNTNINNTTPRNRIASAKTIPCNYSHSLISASYSAFICC